MTDTDQNPLECGTDDVERAYYVFLGRAPEQAYASQWSSSSDLAHFFINSVEFDLEVAQSILRGQFPPARRFAGEPTAAMRQWMGSFLPVSARSRRKLAQAHGWREALQLLFSDAKFRKSVPLIDKGWSLDGLAKGLSAVKGGAFRSARPLSRQAFGLRNTAGGWGQPHDGMPPKISSIPKIDAAELQADLVRDMNESVEDTDHMRERIQVIANSALFDPNFYAREAALDTTTYGLARHYLLFGEAQGLRPSLIFDPEHYNKRHPDVRDAGFNALLHYEVSGKNEGRKYSFLAGQQTMRTAGLDVAKSTILLVCHEATRTGAPVLGWNLATELSVYHNVVVVLLDGGSLEPAFSDVAVAVIGPVRHLCADHYELMALSRSLVSAYNPVYVIGNSVESGPVVRGLRELGVPLVLLVHEFSSHSLPRGKLLIPLYAAADHIVFPAPIVAQSSFDDYNHILLQNVHILPQGPSSLPPPARDYERTFPATSGALADNSFLRNAVNGLLGLWRLVRDDVANSLKTAFPLFERAAISDGISPQDDTWTRQSLEEFVVIGLGTVDLRKGVDLFLATATSLQRVAPEISFRFVWIGHNPSPSSPYQILLDEQIKRGGLEDSFEFVDAVADLEPVYDAADALFMSSRMDPLPNVAIDAALRGLPVICFENATGMAEFLALDHRTAFLAVPYLDTGAAADVLANLARDRINSERLGVQLSARAKETFDMPRYARRLNELGMTAAQHADAVAAGVELVAYEGNFDPELYAAREANSVSRETLIKRYLDDSRKMAYPAEPVQGQSPRRPLAGFHPLAYASDYAGFPRDGSANPLVHFLNEGRPQGSWTHPCIRLEGQPPAVSGLTTVLHGHFHYTDNFKDCIDALHTNRSEIDLMLTTNSAASAKYLKRLSRRFKNGTVTIRTLPNIGRDIGPFLQLLDEGAFDSYDVVGHVHGKKSLLTTDLGTDTGNRWRIFLWEHLLGGLTPAADIILEAMEKDPTLGLIFPENPDLMGWEKNLPHAEKLAKRMGLSQPLPKFFDFPVGTMFWARPAALRPFVTARFTAMDYPVEPLAVDGTMLHAIERLLTPAILDAGYRFATTYNSRVVRW